MRASSTIRFAALVCAGISLALHPAGAQKGISALDTAIARMGGSATLAGVERVRFEMMTQWQRSVFDGRRYADQPSYEWHSDLRDYGSSSWRNTRRFLVGTTWREIADVVRDNIAIRRSPGGSGGVASPAVVAAGTWAPLNVAYVDERRELFAMAPERLVLAARAAKDLRTFGDTSINGVTLARVQATVSGVPTTLFIRRTDGLLAGVSFRATETNDFGLVPWGEMTVEFWYSAWRKYPSGIVYPHQWDVRRVGQPYKRMTVLSAAFNPPAMPDSFVVSDSLRMAYLATATRPMHDIPLDSARIIDGRFAWFNTPGAPGGAVRLGRSWVLLEGGYAPLSTERSSAFLVSNDPSTRIAAAILTVSGAGSGGAGWLQSKGVPIMVAPGARRALSLSLEGYKSSSHAVTEVKQGQWFKSDGDSLWMEPINLPDAPGSLMVYVPSLEWIYAGSAASPLHLDAVLARARAAGWRVSRVGSLRAISAPVPPVAQASR